MALCSWALLNLAGETHSGLVAKATSEAATCSHCLLWLRPNAKLGGEVPRVNLGIFAEIVENGSKTSNPSRFGGLWIDSSRFGPIPGL